ncbi:MAG: hypothetical protein ACRD3W_26975, partial [Terriglobales bacterium]
AYIFDDKSDEGMTILGRILLLWNFNRYRFAFIAKRFQPISVGISSTKDQKTKGPAKCGAQ